MKLDTITVEVEANLNVSQSTAEACLKLVEIYLNNNSNIQLAQYLDHEENLQLIFEILEEGEHRLVGNNGCEGCEHEQKAPIEYPCNECKNCYGSRYLPKEKLKED